MRGIFDFCLPQETSRARTTSRQKVVWLGRSVVNSTVSLVLPRSAILHARPAPEVAFLVDAAARRAPVTGRGEALLAVLAQLEAHDRSRRGLDVSGAAT